MREQVGRGRDVPRDPNITRILHRYDRTTIVRILNEPLPIDLRGEPSQVIDRFDELAMPHTTIYAKAQLLDEGFTFGQRLAKHVIDQGPEPVFFLGIYPKQNRKRVRAELHYLKKHENAGAMRVVSLHRGDEEKRVEKN